MLLWMEQATIDVVLWASKVSMLVKLPILIVAPGLRLLGAREGGQGERPRSRQPRPAERLEHGAAIDVLAHQLVDDFESVLALHADPPWS